MLFSIDSAKIEELLKDHRPAYDVTISGVEMPSTIEHAQAFSLNVSSTTVAIPMEMQRSRERLLALRGRLIANGGSPLAEGELERELDEARGRG